MPRLMRLAIVIETDESIAVSLERIADTLERIETFLIGTSIEEVEKRGREFNKKNRKRYNKKKKGNNPNEQIITGFLNDLEGVNDVDGTIDES